MIRRTVALSLSFSDGGAERVLASIINSGEVSGISLSNRIDYVNEAEANIEYIKKVPKNRALSFIFRLAFLIKVTYRKEKILVCSHDLFLVLVLLNNLGINKYELIYRPSIDADFVKKNMADRFGFLFPIMWPVFVRGVRNSLCIFQTPNIEASFAPETFSLLQGRVIPNPVDISTSFRCWSYEARQPIRLLYVGRQTLVKGFDRFLMLPCIWGQENIEYECYGRSGDVELDPNSCCINMGWVNTQDISSQNAVLVLPSRLEGLSNVLLEALAAEWPVVISHEVANLLNHLPIIRGACFIINFERKVDEVFDFQSLLLNSEAARRRREARAYIETTMNTKRINRQIIDFCKDMTE